MFTSSKVKKITGASHYESINIPFYYAPPFLDELRKRLESGIKSTDREFHDKKDK